MKKRSLSERFRPKENASSAVVGVTWYTEDNWARVKATATDPERFEESFPEWHAMAAEALADLKKAGVNVVKFNVLSNELLPWCLVHSKPNNAASRAEFVSEKLRAPGEAGA